MASVAEPSLTITKYSAKNVLKFADFTVTPGKITRFRGANDQGKTTALRLVQIAMEGSTNPHVIHEGADKGEILVEFSDGIQLRRSFTEKGQYPKLTDSEGRQLPSPQAYLNRLLGAHQFNPLAFLEAPPKEQVRLLLQAIHVKLNPEEVREATGYDAPAEVDFSRHGLEVLADLREHFASERKAENAAVKRMRDEAAAIRSKLPAERPDLSEERRAAVAENLDARRQELTKIEARALAADEQRRAAERIEEAKRREQDRFDELAAEISELEDRIHGLRNRQQECRNRAAQLDRELAAANDSPPPSEAEISAARARVEDAEAELRRLKAFEEIAQEFDRAARFDDDAATRSVTAAGLDAAVRIVTNDLPAKLMEKAALPVGSLSIDGDQILVDGQDLGFQATSKQMSIALAIARALNPKLKVICVDGLESLDRERLEAFIAEASQDDYQYLCAEVDPEGGPLSIETVEGEVA